MPPSVNPRQSTSLLALGDPVKAWMARGRELNALYDALTDAVGRSPNGDPVEDLKALAAERDQLRAGLIHLLAWIDGWRDEYDGKPEARWKAGFTDTTPELVKARNAL